MIRVGFIGTGNVVVQNHIPGILTHPQARIVALADTSEASLSAAATAAAAHAPRTFSKWQEIVDNHEVDAIVIATPNYLHKEIVLAAAAAGKHIMCEKPLALDLDEALVMTKAAQAAGIVNMIAFTYRFVPAMRYMSKLIEDGFVGLPYHFRVNRLQDWGGRAVGWRQVRSLAGSGELGDMLSHRIDYAHFLIGPISRVVAMMKQYLSERTTADGKKQSSDVDDFVAFLCEFENGTTTGNFESTKMAAGRGFYLHSQDYVEVNGSEGSLVYFLNQPHKLMVGKAGGDLESVDVPDALLKTAGSPRNPHEGDPLQVFRYDQSFEFIQAIIEKRPSSTDFAAGAQVQAVMDAIIESARSHSWVDVTSCKMSETKLITQSAGKR